MTTETLQSNTTPGTSERMGNERMVTSRMDRPTPSVVEMGTLSRSLAFHVRKAQLEGDGLRRRQRPHRRAEDRRLVYEQEN